MHVAGVCRLLVLTIDCLGWTDLAFPRGIIVLESVLRVVTLLSSDCFFPESQDHRNIKSGVKINVAIAGTSWLGLSNTERACRQ